MLSLLKYQIRIRQQILYRKPVHTRKRVSVRYEHMRPGFKQFLKPQITLCNQLTKHCLITLAQVQYTNLASPHRYVVNDFIGLCLTQREAVRVRIILPYHIDKCIYSKRIVLARYRKVRLKMSLPLEMLGHYIHLL